MSGRATGWVLKNFPIATPADRNRKLILLGVADAANVEGTFSRPGIAPLAAAWSFDRATVIRHLKWLCENGWLEELEKGVGRGNASSYSLPKMVATCTDKRSQPAPEPTEKRSQSTLGKVAIVEDLSSSSTVVINGSEAPTLEGLESPAPEKPLERRITERVFERKDPKPTTPFVGVAKIARRLLDVGWKPQQIEDAMVAVRTISLAWVEGELNKSKGAPRARAKVDTERESPTGRVQL